MNTDYLPDSPISFNRDFVYLGAGVIGALFLSQAAYWYLRADDQDGWFSKTQAEWEEETGLTRSEQETARKKLRAGGFLDEKKEGLPRKIYFKLNEDAILKAITNSEAYKKTQSEFMRDEITH